MRHTTQSTRLLIVSVLWSDVVAVVVKVYWVVTGYQGTTHAAAHQAAVGATAARVDGLALAHGARLVRLHGIEPRESTA
jgi:hypothetical protein